MDWDEPDPKKKKPEGKVLDTLSVAELEDHIAWLESEIARARDAIAAKKNVRAGAESLFRR